MTTTKSTKSTKSAKAEQPAAAVLAVDPASRRTGFAVLGRDGPCGVLLEAGHLSATDDDPFRRIFGTETTLGLVDDLRGLVLQWRPAAVVLEVPSGLPGHGSKRGAGAALAIYGLAVGALWQAVRDIHCRRAILNGYVEIKPCQGWHGVVAAATEREWTGGKSKEQRRLMAMTLYPVLAATAKRDPGGDASDAVLLGQWWLTNRVPSPNCVDVLPACVRRPRRLKR